MTPELARAVDDERARSARYLMLVRPLVISTLLAVHCGLLAFTGATPLGGGLPVLVGYCALAWIGWLAVRVRPSLLRHAWLTPVLIDIPLFAVGCYFSGKNGLAHGVSGETGLVLFVVLMQLGFRRREVVLAGVVAAAAFALVLWRLGAPVEAVSWVVIPFPAAVAWALYLPGRVTVLVERALSEQASRLREVETLNQELRHQIGDRAGQLASAIARLSMVPRTLEPGMTVAERYRVLRELGKGGMGTVYEVERTSDQKRLALKVLSGVADRDALVRFAREAQIAAQLDHPNVVSVLDVDVAKSGMLFLVMELLAGSTLAAEKARWGDEEWARPILKQVAEALAAMHAKGIVHRDLKPANVLLAGKIAKVADFGIASLLPDAGDSTITKGLTRTGAFMGTPVYMAPELLKGARDAQSSADVWSFGVMAHELLTGKLPFGEPPVIARLEGRSLSLSIGNELVARCLSEDPARRPSAKELTALF